jgi:hypothetical protein
VRPAQDEARDYDQAGCCVTDMIPFPEITVRFPFWLDQPTPASWNTPGLPIPAAPRIEGAVDPRCGDLARPPQLEEDNVDVRDNPH